MTKSDERAAEARSLILKGEQKSVIAEKLGYKSVGGMMGSIAMLEHKEKTGRGVSNKARRSLQAVELPGAQPIFPKEKPGDKIDVLAEAAPAPVGGIRVDVERNNGLYARLEGRHLTASYIGYRKSLNICAKLAQNRQMRLFEEELGYKGAMLEAVKELREIFDRLIALLEGRDGEEQNQ